ncbi:glucosamine-6-phosphate deaminase [Bacillaceae bacterium S4-13-56]
MNVKVNDSFEESSLAAADLIIETVKEKPDSMICFAAGSTPIRTFEILINKSKSSLIDFSNCTFVGLDEWIGMDKNDKGSCQETLYTSLFVPLNISSQNIHFFNTKSSNLRVECKKIDQIIANNGNIDLMLLGIGQNGHLGFNEPGVSFDSFSHVVNLSEVTKTVGQKYFEGSRELSMGITLGIRHILDAKCLIVLASGIKKNKAVYEMVHGKITNEWPVSILQTHKNCQAFLDKEAACLLNEAQ